MRWISNRIPHHNVYERGIHIASLPMISFRDSRIIQEATPMSITSGLTNGFQDTKNELTSDTYECINE
jgi:hypothetical protein